MGNLQSYKGVMFYTKQRNKLHFWYLVGSSESTDWAYDTRTLARKAARRAIDIRAEQGTLSATDMAAYKHHTTKRS